MVEITRLSVVVLIFQGCILKWLLLGFLTRTFGAGLMRCCKILFERISVHNPETLAIIPSLNFTLSEKVGNLVAAQTRELTRFLSREFSSCVYLCIFHRALHEQNRGG